MTISARPDTVTAPSRYTGQGAKLTTELQRYYSLFLWDMDLGQIPVDGTLDISSTRKFLEFFFTVAPKSIEVSEPFTTKVVATQNGGKFIESHGSIFKNIRISGTTGLRPNKKVNIVNGSPNPDEATGFDDIVFLRNIFRRYSDLKAIGTKVVMVWRNIKDDDYWIVEPQDFKINQDSKSPLTYMYSIQLQGVSKFDSFLATVASVEDPQANLQSDRRTVSRIREYINQATNSFMIVSTYVSAIKGAGYFAIGSLFTPITNTIKMLASVNNSIAAPVVGLRQTVEQAGAAIDQALAVIGPYLEEESASGVLKRHPAVRELRRLKLTFAKILVEKGLVNTVAKSETQRRLRAAAAYVQVTNGLSGPTRSPSTGGDPSYVGSGRGATTVAEDNVHGGETIRDLAKRLLGDARRWHELVILNDLRPPYTSDVRGRAGVLGPGDLVLYQSNEPGVIGSNVRIGTATDDEIAELESYLAAQSYGRDIRIKDTTVDNGFLTDIDVNQQGDISTIVGVPNVEQALNIKFRTEIGSLPAHPGFGANFGLGRKADIAAFNTFRIQTLATLKSDLRVSRVESLTFTTTGDVLSVSAKLQLKNTRDYLSTDFSLRRF